MAEWYSTTVHRVHGPHTASELKRLAARRLITPDALVGQTSDGPWIAASRIRGLFPTRATGQPHANGRPPATPAVPTAAAAATLPARATAWLRDGSVPTWKRSLACAVLAAAASTALLLASMACIGLVRPTAPGPVALRAFLTIMVLGMSFSAAQSLCIGIRGLIRRRPVVFSTRLVMWPIMAVLALAGLGAIFLAGHQLLFVTGAMRSGLGIGAFLGQAAVCLSLMYVLWREATGYLAYGIDDDSFRNALVLALHRRGHAFHERITKIVLIETNVEIRATVQSKIGTALMRTVHRRDAHLVATLAADMNAHYRIEDESFNKGIFVLSTIQGVAGGLLTLPLAMMLLR